MAFWTCCILLSFPQLFSKPSKPTAHNNHGREKNPATWKLIGQNGLKILLYKALFQRTALSDLFSGSLTQSLPCTVFSLGALVKNNQRKLFNTTVAWGGDLELGQAEKPKSWKGKAGEGDIHRRQLWCIPGNLKVHVHV